MKKPTVICVDDEKFVLSSLKTQLKRSLGDGYFIEVAESAEEAFEIIEQLTADGVQIPLIISDQIMPGIKGDQFLIEVHQKIPATLKILLTGQADTIAIGNAVNKARLYRYISKPWEESDMSLTVNEAVRSFFTDVKLQEQNALLQELNENLEKKVVERTKEIELKNHIIETKNRDITDSILYARIIQNAVFPPLSYFEQLFAQWFIINQPRDIVSGDFYWVDSVDDKIVIAVSDCTGHGVPGGFMSMLGISFLNEIIHKNTPTTASSILEELRNKIKTSLHQKGEFMEAKDGMDIALCIIDTSNGTLHYAGAKTPLIIVRDKQIIHLKADYQPVSVYINERPFTNNIFQIQPGDTFYMFTDGTVDQLGSIDNKKFSSMRLKNILLQCQNLPLIDQAPIITQELASWKDQRDQTDDILLVGFKLITN